MVIEFPFVAVVLIFNFGFMKTVCRYSPCRDIREVDDFGYVDLADALESGCIPASVAPSSASFDATNGASLSPSQVFGKPSDQFEAYEMRSSLESVVRSVEEVDSSSSSSD